MSTCWVGVVSHWRVVCSYLALQNWFFFIHYTIWQKHSPSPMLCLPTELRLSLTPCAKTWANDHFQTEKIEHYRIRKQALVKMKNQGMSHVKWLGELILNSAMCLVKVHDFPFRGPAKETVQLRKEQGWSHNCEACFMPIKMKHSIIPRQIQSIWVFKNQYMFIWPFAKAMYNSLKNVCWKPSFQAAELQSDTYSHLPHSTVTQGTQ